MKRVKSRNQMILDLSVSSTKTSPYKNTIQRDAWGSTIFLRNCRIIPDISQESSWRTFFLRGKKRIDTELDIPDREALP